MLEKFFITKYDKNKGCHGCIYEFCASYMCDIVSDLSGVSCINSRIIFVAGPPEKTLKALSGIDNLTNLI